jgi:hypothetical protein
MYTHAPRSIIFTSSDYPCDLPSVLLLTLSNVGSPRVHIHELALRLMMVLYKGHLNESQPIGNTPNNSLSSADDIAYILTLASNYSKSQMLLCEYLARRRPDLTMAIFSGRMRYLELESSHSYIRRNNQSNSDGECH